tara:strand:+ start:381 stop:1187 length:807 start_codon:yes stop_codon:yes gene_type:complete
VQNNIILRILSAALLAPTTLIIIYLGNWYIVFFVSFAGILALSEWDYICNLRANKSNPVLYYLRLVFIIPLFVFFLHVGNYSISILIFFVGQLISIFIFYNNAKNLFFSCLSFFYLMPPIISLILISDIYPKGTEYILLIFLMVWCTDTGAMIFGKIFGGIKFVPSISPAKTWSGVLGGIILPVFLGVLCAIIFQVEIFFFLIFSIIISILAQFGDLTESFIKRYHGVKNSGQIIPGHGGLLDRIDSLIFVFPALLIFLYFGNWKIFL